MNILSLQSWVVYGHVGNAAAVFPLQRLGAEVWALHTVQFANHTGYPDCAGERFGAASLSSIIDGIARRGALDHCDAVLSGYLGEPDIGDAVLHAVQRAKAGNARALYCCDPVIGDAGRVYVRPGVVEFLRNRALPAADIAVPNQFELSLLAGREAETIEEAKKAIARLQAIGPGTVLASGLHTDATPADAVDLMVGEGGAFYLLRTPRLPLAANGAGDLLAALFLFHRLRTGAARPSLEQATASLFGVLRRTAEAGARELVLIEAQDELVRPSQQFTAVPC